VNSDRSITAKYLKLAGKAALLLLVLYLGYRLLLLSLVLFAPFIIATLVALAVERPVGFLERRLQLSRNIATLLVLSGLGYAFGLVLVWMLGRIIAELSYFISRLPHWQTLLTEQGEMFIVVLQEYLNFLPLDFNALPSIEAYVSTLVERLGTALPVMLTAVVGLASLVPKAVVFTLVVVVATFFIAIDLEQHKVRFYALISRGNSRPLFEVFGRLLAATYGWLKTQLVMMAVTTFIVMVGLIVLDVRYVLLIAVIVGLVDALPVLGPGAIFAPWIFWSLLAGNIGLAVGLSVLYGATLLARYTLSPLILSENIGIKPLHTLIASYIGLVLLGFLGLALGPILLVVYQALTEIGFIDKVKDWLFS